MTTNTGDGPPVFALLGAGGTGGHTYPAVALARELVARGHPAGSVRFIGGNRGFEERVVTDAVFAIDLLPLDRGLSRTVSIGNVGVVASAVRAAWRGHRLVRRYRPRVVVGFGSYVSLPCVVAARAARIPTIVHEQDAAPGLANRLSVRLGARGATSLPDTPLRGARLVGDPIRPEFASLERVPAAPPLLAIVGGSLGAGSLNRAGLALAERWRDRADVAVHHVSGPRNFDECRRSLDAVRQVGDRLSYTLVSYEDHIDQLYAARCSLALCRSGSGSVAELTAAGVPAVLVPLPGAPSDHQTHNARTLESHGAAVLVPDHECEGARLAPLLSELLTDGARLEAMSKSARAMARPDAAERLADFVEECAVGSDAAGFDLVAPRTVHIVAIGGAGMSAIARYLHALGHTVSGSDQRESKLLARLATEGITTFVGHRAEQVPADCDAVAISAAVRDTNLEVVEARRRNIPVLSRADALQLVVGTSPRAIAISGTHGKTTTTGMVTAVLRAGGLHPSFIAGGIVADLGTNAARDSGEWIVVEGDESDGAFLQLPRDAVLVTNIEADHLDHWGTFEKLTNGFEEFVAIAPGPRVLCADNAVSARLAGAIPSVTYGFDASARYRASGYGGMISGSQFDLSVDGAFVASIPLRMHGRHNALNATGAAALALEIGVPVESVVEGLSGFGGMARRFEFRSHLNGADFYDDYAHTASEIVATLALAREIASDAREGESVQRVVAVVQPHRYTRISRHAPEFADAFVDADVVVVTGLDGASEDPIPGVSSQLVVDAVLGRHPDTDLTYLPEWDALRDLPWRFARSGDLVVTLGCGDITRVHDDWLAEGERRGES